MKLGQNAAYEEAEYKYEEEEVYEVPTWNADMLYALHECKCHTFSKYLFCSQLLYPTTFEGILYLFLNLICTAAVCSL